MQLTEELDTLGVVLRSAKEGRWYAGLPPFGYVFSGERRTLVPDPVKAPIVRRIFDL
jgi:hypothetical protein